MTAHELARRVGIAPHVVRYYTQRGLLRPARNARNRYREYAESDVYRLQFICRAKTVGFTLSDVQLILRDADGGVAPCPEVRRLVELRAAENERRLADAERLQRRIRAAVEVWRTIPDQPPDHESLCRLIDALALGHGP
jgi:MerR family transcriptional regulator, Zn(II)-responsive regulator of zntA